MDNFLQIEEIKKYRSYLSEELGVDVDVETAAKIWVTQYAHAWRLTHPRHK